MFSSSSSSMAIVCAHPAYLRIVLGNGILLKRFSSNPVRRRSSQHAECLLKPCVSVVLAGSCRSQVGEGA